MSRSCNEEAIRPIAERDAGSSNGVSHRLIVDEEGYEGDENQSTAQEAAGNKGEKKHVESQLTTATDTSKGVTGGVDVGVDYGRRTSSRTEHEGEGRGTRDEDEDWIVHAPLMCWAGRGPCQCPAKALLRPC